MPPSPRLTREKIAAAARQIADREGLEALSMRKVAAALGVGAMSLYNHVRDKADLEGLLLDAVFAPSKAAPKPKPKPTAWQTRAKAAMHAMRDALNRHPALVPLLLKRTTTSAAALQLIEDLLAALADGGFKGRALLRAYHTLLSFLTGHVLTDLTGAFAIGNKRALPDVAQSVLALDAERFPHLRACAKLAAQGNGGDEFEFGLEAVLDGLKRSAGLAA